MPERPRPIETQIATWRRIPSTVVLGVVLIALTFSTSCATRRSNEALVLVVSNELGRTIAEIWRKDCTQPKSEFTEIKDSKLHPGEVGRFELPPTCVDLAAYDERGRLVGEQRDLRMLPGARWVLRR